MSSLVPVAVPAIGPGSLVRRAGLGLLVPAELLTLSVRFDTAALTGDGRWWAPFLGEAHYLPQLALTVAVAVVLFGGERLKAAGAVVQMRAGESHSWVRALVVHLFGFAAFAFFTARLLESRDAGTTTLLGWGIAAAAMIGGWGLTLLPFAAWKELLARLGWGLLAIIAVVGGLGFAAGLASESLWNRLADVTLVAVRALLEVGFANVTCEPGERLLGAEGFLVRIAPSCSGYEGLGLVAAFAGVFLILQRNELRFPAALLLLPLGLAAAWLANVLRIASLISLGAGGWPEIAAGGFHSQAGWLGFNAVALGVIVAARRCRFFARRTEVGANPVVPYLAPLVAIVGTAMLTGALASGCFDALYGVRVLVAGLAILACARRLFSGAVAMPSGTALGIGGFVVVLWIGVGYESSFATDVSPIASGLAELPPALATLWLALRIAGAVLIVPLAEELAFRGFLLRRLQAADFESVPPTCWSWPAVLASSLLFGMLHPGWWFAGTVAGVGYAAAYWRRGRLADAVIAHALTNALLAVFVMFTGHWYFW